MSEQKSIKDFLAEHSPQPSTSREPERAKDAPESKPLSEAQRHCLQFHENNRKSRVVETLEVYKLLKLIGEGTYGIVYRAVDTRNNLGVAIKQMNIDQDDEGLPSVALREITFLGELHHKNIVNLLDVLTTDQHLMLVFEFLVMDLRDYQTKLIQRQRRMPEDLIRRFTYQMFDGLAYVHSRHIVHRDMKPQNVLVDIKNSLVKIADFGLGRHFTCPLKIMTNQVVTLWYRCPELLLGADIYDPSVDVWSMGVMIIELFENDPPFDPDSEIRALHMIFETFGTPTKEMWADVVHLRHYNDLFPKWPPKPWNKVAKHASEVVLDLLKRLLVYDPQDRINCREAMQHAYFDTEHGPDLRTPDPNEPPLPPKFLSPRNMFMPYVEEDEPITPSNEVGPSTSSFPDA